MTNDIVSIIGKPVKDMYGTDFGTVLGMLTHIDGSIQTVGIDCGSEGLKQIPYDQISSKRYSCSCALVFIFRFFFCSFYLNQIR